MNRYQRLELNLIHTLIEEQIKLGYYPNTVNLYYPTASICRLLKLTTQDQLKEALSAFKEMVLDHLGPVKISKVSGDRILFSIPPKGAEYVYETYKDREFLTKLIFGVQEHGITIDEVKALFEQYCEDVCMEKMESEDFDYAIYSATGRPDDYVYCFKKEHEHLTYHRFTREDYEDLIK